MELRKTISVGPDVKEESAHSRPEESNLDLHTDYSAIMRIRKRVP